MSEFLTNEEKNFILDKAEFLKVSRMLADVVGELKKNFNQGQETQKYKPEIPNELSGLNLEINLYLDNVTPESLEDVFPLIKRNLAEYHRLRIYQREIEKRIHRTNGPVYFDVVEKT